MFTKKRIIIAIISAVLVAALAVGAVFIVGGSSKDDRVTEYQKRKVAPVTAKLNGEDVSFTYDHSKKYKLSLDYASGAKQEYQVQDYYVSEQGYTLIKYEDADGFLGLMTNDYEVNDDPSLALSEDEIKEIAYEMASRSDLTLEGLSKTKTDIIDRGTAYDVIFTCDYGEVLVYIHQSGKIFAIKVTHDYSNKISGERKEAAREKMEAHVAQEVLKLYPDAKYFVEEEKYELEGTKVYAKFHIVYYPHPQSDNPTPETDACGAVGFKCEV